MRSSNFKKQNNRTRFKPYKAHRSLFLLSLIIAIQPIHASVLVELRGVLHSETIGWIFSIHEPETGRATWLRMNQIRNGYYINHYDEKNLTVSIQMNKEVLRIPLNKSNDIALPIQFSPIELSTYNQRLYEHRNKLILQQFSKSTSNQSIRKQKAEVAQITADLTNFLMTNPSAEALNERIGELGEKIDYAALMEIDPGPSVTSRNAQNTAGWGIKKSVDFKQLEQTLATNPSIETINELVHAQ